MVAMAALQLVHLVDGDFASGVEDGEKSSGRCSLGSGGSLSVYVCYRFRVRRLGSIQKLTVTTSALGRWSLGARAQRLPGCHQQHQAGSSTGAATTARQRLTPVAVVVIRWSKNLDVIFNMFGVFCTSCELL